MLAKTKVPQKKDKNTLLNWHFTTIIKLTCRTSSN